MYVNPLPARAARTMTREELAETAAVVAALNAMSEQLEARNVDAVHAARVPGARRLAWGEALQLADEQERARVRRTAYHEAGHAVAFCAAGAGCAEAAIRYSIEDGRFVLHGGHCLPRRPEKVEAFCFAAGYAAVCPRRSR